MSQENRPPACYCPRNTIRLVLTGHNRARPPTNASEQQARRPPSPHAPHAHTPRARTPRMRAHAHAARPRLACAPRACAPAHAHARALRARLRRASWPRPPARPPSRARPPPFASRATGRLLTAPSLAIPSGFTQSPDQALGRLQHKCQRDVRAQRAPSPRYRATRQRRWRSQRRSTPGATPPPGLAPRTSSAENFYPGGCRTTGPGTRSR